VVIEGMARPQLRSSTTVWAGKASDSCPIPHQPAPRSQRLALPRRARDNQPGGRGDRFVIQGNAEMKAGAAPRPVVSGRWPQRFLSFCAPLPRPPPDGRSNLNTRPCSQSAFVAPASSQGRRSPWANIRPWEALLAAQSVSLMCRGRGVTIDLRQRPAEERALSGSGPAEGARALLSTGMTRLNPGFWFLGVAESITAQSVAFNRTSNEGYARPSIRSFSRCWATGK